MYNLKSYCEMHIVKYILWNVHCEMLIVKYILWNAYREIPTYKCLGNIYYGKKGKTNG